MLVYDFVEALNVPRPAQGEIVLIRIPNIGRGLAAREQLRSALVTIGQRWYGAEMTLRETPVGPQWTQPVGLLSISYDGTDGWVAWSDVRRIGCDAVVIKEFPERKDVSARYLGATIAARLATSRLPLEAFVHAWAKFEAGLKAHGLPLTEDRPPVDGQVVYHRYGEVVVAVWVEA